MCFTKLVLSLYKLLLPASKSFPSDTCIIYQIWPMHLCVRERCTKDSWADKEMIPMCNPDNAGDKMTATVNTGILSHYQIWMFSIDLAYEGNNFSILYNGQCVRGFWIISKCFITFIKVHMAMMNGSGGLKLTHMCICINIYGLLISVLFVLMVCPQIRV